MEIRHIAAARDVPIVAVDAWKYEVEVWNAKSPTKISSFPTQLEPGGERLAISHDGTRVAAAAFEKHGLTGQFRQPPERIASPAGRTQRAPPHEWRRRTVSPRLHRIFISSIHRPLARTAAVSR
jgi:hypothetical protein